MRPVEALLGSKPLLQEFWEAALHQKTFRLGPVEEMPMQSCGPTPMARIYSPEEAILRPPLGESHLAGTLEESLRDYELFVTKHAALTNQVREKIITKRHKRFRLAYIQW